MGVIKDGKMRKEGGKVNKEESTKKVTEFEMRQVENTKRRK